MQPFIFYNPTKIVFGKNTTEQIGKEISSFAGKVMLIYGKESIKNNGIYDKVVNSLKKSGIEFIEKGGVKPNPVISFVREAAQLFKKENLDAVLAVGGGSVIDTAKAVAAAAKADFDPWEFYLGEKVVKEAFPVAVVLTIAATASEMNPTSVITNEETKQKYNCVSPLLYPKVSVLDPVNTFTVPKNQTANGAIDTMIHVLETYLNAEDRNVMITDSIIEAIIKTTIDSAEKIFKDPTDYDARANMMWASTLALNGLTASGAGPKIFPMHMIEHSLSAIYDIAHGAGLAIVGPAWMKYKVQKNNEKFAKLAKNIFDFKGPDKKAQAKALIAAFESWFKKAGAPVRLSDASIPENDIEKIAVNAEALGKKWGLTEYSKEVIEEILRLAV
ncbi:MAG: iron-containing alcohol dehydrogenase [Desulforegulaceae bacterium]|nr:iron-containing alcohol dehydrogenase [Desulforegulaceae bacterium]